jgi:drug/metabolite transporter (DMT)-like permease
MLQHRFVLWSGVLGATASCLAKLALSSALLPDNNNGTPLLLGTAQSAFPWLYQTCQAQLTATLPHRRDHEDLDTVLLNMVYWVLGELLVKYHIALVGPWHGILRFLERIGLFFHLFEMDWCHGVLLLPRIGGLITVLILNGFMIAYFVKGIQASGSVAGPALTSAMNFIVSATYGYFLWGETFSEQWWMGFVAVLLGVLLLTTVPATQSEAAATTTTTMTMRAGALAAVGKTGGSRFSTSSPSSLSSSKPGQGPSSWIKSITTTPPKYGQVHTASAGGKPRYAKVAPPSSAPPPPAAAPSTSGMMSGFFISVPKLSTTTTTPAATPRPPPSPKKKKTCIVVPKGGWMDRTFVNQCPLCEGELFDEVTGQSPMAVADLSPACFHIFHAKCLKSEGGGGVSPNTSPAATGFSGTSRTTTTTTTPRRSSTQAAGCPICEKNISMWISAKQAAHFAGFWIDRVEALLLELGPSASSSNNNNQNSDPKPLLMGPQPVPAQLIRDRLKLDPTLTPEQLRYIDEDPTGLGKGLQSALEWGGYVDYNATGSRKGHVGWSSYLRSRGIWSYHVKHDDLWLWRWDTVHPRQRCDGCQFLKRPLPVQCQGCTGSSEGAFYCSTSCQKRDWQRHKLMCETWQANFVPPLDGKK